MITVRIKWDDHVCSFTQCLAHNRCANKLLTIWDSIIISGYWWTLVSGSIRGHPAFLFYLEVIPFHILSVHILCSKLTSFLPFSSAYHWVFTYCAQNWLRFFFFPQLITECSHTVLKTDFVSSFFLSLSLASRINTFSSSFFWGGEGEGQEEGK
jgi:hypothetical protein